MTSDASEVVRDPFAGGEFDEEAGQICYRKRCYDGPIVVFRREDPAGRVFDDTLYRFFENAPFCKYDVNGLGRIAAGAGGGFAIGELPGPLFWRHHFVDPKQRWRCC